MGSQGSIGLVTTFSAALIISEFDDVLMLVLNMNEIKKEVVEMIIHKKMQDQKL